MSKFCPNKNTREYKRMAKVLGDSVATSTWHDNGGYSIWKNSDGTPSKLWAALEADQGISMDTAIAMRARSLTQSFITYQSVNKRTGEATAKELFDFIKKEDAQMERLALYTEFNLVDKNDPTKIIKWSQTEANFTKVRGIVQKINSGSVASAEVGKVAVDGKIYYNIVLTRKTAFTTADGDAVAFYDKETGEITLTDKGLTAETVIHEFAHPFIDALAKNNPELYNNLLNDIKKDAKVPEIKEILDHVATHYSKSGEQIKDKELLAYVLSEYGKGNINPETGKNTATAIERFYKWLSTLAKDMIEQMTSNRTLFVDQIHPGTKYKEVADLFTVYSELGDINLGVSAKPSKKIAPNTITSTETKQSRGKARRAKKRENGTLGKGEAHKAVKASTAEFVDIKSEADYMSTLLPKEIATELVEGYIKVLEGGHAVVGMFKNGAISLSTRGPKGTAYHEGFHAVFRTLLATSEQKALVVEAKKEFGNATPKQILDIKLEHDVSTEEATQIFYEEILADEFADFMTNKVPPVYPKGVAGLFSRLKNWLKHVFSNRVVSERLFSNISLGKYSKKTPNISRGVAYKVHPLYDIQQVHKITKELVSIAFDGVVTVEDIQKSNINMLDISNKLDEIAGNAEDTGNEELADRIDELFGEDDTLDKFWLAEIDGFMRHSLNLKSKVNESITEEDIDEENMEDLEKLSFLKSSYEISGKVNATTSIKYMIAMTPKKKLIDPSKDATLDNLETETSTLTGLPVLVDYGIMYNDVENLLAGTAVTIENGEYQDGLNVMLSLLKSQAKYKPEMAELASRIEQAHYTVRTQFYNAFSRQKSNFVHHQIAGSKKQKNVQSKFTTSNFSTKSSIIFDNWVTGFVQNMGHLKDGALVYNADKLSAFSKAHDAFLVKAQEAAVAVQVEGKKFPKSIITEFENLLGKLGITVQPNTIAYMLDKELANGYEAEFNVELSEAFEGIIGDFNVALTGLAEREGTIFGVNNQLQDNTRFFKTVLAESDAYFKQVPGESSFAGPGGSQIYTFQDNDLTSKSISQFKAGDLSKLEQLAGSPYGTNSLWLNALLDTVEGANNREMFELFMYGNLKSEETADDKGAKASELKPVDAYMDAVNKQLTGFYIGLAEADKSRQTYIKGPKMIPSGLSINAENVPVIMKNSQGFKVLKGYLADEISRMRVAHAVTQDTSIEHKWVLNYHYYQVKPGEGTIGKNLDKIPGNAAQSFLFPNLNFVELGLKDANTGEMYAMNNDNFNTNVKLDKAIKNSFWKLVKAEMSYAHEIGLLSGKNEVGSYENALVSHATAQKYNRGGAVDVTNMMADYVLNSIIGNVEQTKLFNGDPAIYKVKGVDKIGQPVDKANPNGPKVSWATLDHFGDFMKRIPAIFASGKDFRIFNKPDGTPVVRSHYQSATIANIEVPSAFFGATQVHILGSEEDLKDFKENINNKEKAKPKFNKKNMEQVQKATGISMEKLEELFAPYLEINQTDAQAWITLDAYRERMQGLGKWTEAHDVAYEQSVAGENMTAASVKLLAQPLKTVHAELVPTDNGEMIMQYNKQSEAVLLPFMKNMQIGSLMSVMERDGIDHVIVLDGKKAGASGIVDITENGNIKGAGGIKMNPVALSYTNLFLQQDLPSKGVKETLVGSQGVKNVLSVVDLDGDYFNDLNGRELIDLYNSVIGRLSDKGLIDLDNKIGFNKETGELDRAALGELLKQEFEGEVSDNIMEALLSGVSLDALPIKSKIISKLQAIITKSTVKLKQSGASLIQLSDLGFVGTEVKLTDPVKNGIIWLKNPKERLQPMHVKDGEVKPAQILMPHGEFVKMLAGESKAAKAAKETMLKRFGTDNYKELSSTQIASLIGTGVLDGFSYRIPNQGPSSNDAFEIVGVLPAEMGDTMIAFSDITTKTGSDFDIDKSFVILPNFIFDDAQGKIKKMTYDINDLDNARPKSLQNLRLDIMREMIMHPSAYTSVMSPLDDDTFEKFVKDLFPADRASANMAFFTGRTQMQNKMTFDGAKSLVGTIANHMTNHSLVLSENLSFRKYYLGKGIKEHGESKISNKVNEDGVEVASILGAYMNAIVDAAKDPFIVRANLNQYTAGTAFTLIRAGFSSDWVVSFIGQPIIQDVIEAQNNKEGRFGTVEYDVEKGRAISAIEQVLIKHGLTDVTEEAFKSDEKFETLRKNKESDIATTTEELADSIKGGGNPAMQLKVLKQFLEFQGKSKDLNDLIKVAKADVSGATKSLTSAKLAHNLLNKVSGANDAKGLEPITNTNKFLGVTAEDGRVIFKKGEEGKMIGRYFENSVEASLERFSDLFITSTLAAESTWEDLAYMAGYTELVTNQSLEEFVDKVSNEIYASVTTKKSLFNISPEELKNILYGYGKVGPGSKAQLGIAARVQAAKASGYTDNLLLNSLSVRVGVEGSPDNVILPNNDTIKETKDVLYHAWNELLAFKGDPTLGVDLIKYTFYKSGFSKTVGDFSEHIPQDWLKANGFHGDMVAANLELANNSSLLQGSTESIVKHMYKNNKLVPTISDKSTRLVMLADQNGSVLDKAHAFIVPSTEGGNYIIGDGPGGKVFKPYMKRVSYNENIYGAITSTDTKLYKLAGYTTNNDAIYVRINTLGLSGKANNIKEYNGDGKTSIFPKNNVSLPDKVNRLVDAAEKRSLHTGEYDVDPSIDETTETEDKLHFCLMK